MKFEFSKIASYRRMTKKEFLTDIAKSVFGRSAHVESSTCGQRYWFVWKEKDTVRRMMFWIDTLKWGRISLKVKGFSDPMQAIRMSKALWNAAYYSDKNYVLDAKAGADVYRTVPTWGGAPGGYVARLRMDKVW